MAAPESFLDSKILYEDLPLSDLLKRISNCRADTSVRPLELANILAKSFR
jgi:hypothetical protein